MEVYSYYIIFVVAAICSLSLPKFLNFVSILVPTCSTYLLTGYNELL